MDCLVNGVGLGICALPYPDGKLIRLAPRLITILGQYSEGIETIAIDSAFALELGASATHYQPGYTTTLQVDITDVVLEL